MKLFLLSLTLLLVHTSFSQVRLGFFAGPQATTAAYKVSGIKQDNSFKYGLQAGATLKVPFENRLYFSPSVFYSYKGYKVKYSASSSLPDYSATDNNISFHSVEVAFLLQHDFKIEPGHFFIKIGPSLDFALFGKEKFNTNSGSSVSRDMKFGFADYGHYLANAIAQFGYESVGGVFFYANYEYGLTNMSNRDNDGPTIGNRVIGITIGKFLNSKIVIDTKNKQ